MSLPIVLSSGKSIISVPAPLGYGPPLRASYSCGFIYAAAVYGAKSPIDDDALKKLMYHVSLASVSLEPSK